MTHIESKHYVPPEELDRRLVAASVMICGVSLVFWGGLVVDMLHMYTRVRDVHPGSELDFLDENWVDARYSLVVIFACVLLPYWAWFGRYVHRNRVFRRLMLSSAENSRSLDEMVQELEELEQRHGTHFTHTIGVHAISLLRGPWMMTWYAAVVAIIEIESMIALSITRRGNVDFILPWIGLTFLVTLAVPVGSLVRVWRIHRQRDAIIEHAHAQRTDEVVEGAVSMVADAEEGALTQVSAQESRS